MTHDPTHQNPPTETARKAASAEATAAEATAAVSAAPEKPRVRFLDFLGGLPAILAAAGLVGGLAWEARRGTLAQAYENEAAARLKANDLQSSLVLLKRLVSLGDKPEYRFGLVVVYERSGDLARAEFIARTLAPLDDRKPDEVEFQPARFWLARRLVLNSGRYRPRMLEGEKHLKRLLKANPNALPIKMTMADFYFLNGRAREARPFLEEVAPNNPDYLVKLAGVCSILGDKDEARRRANQVIDLAKPLAEKDPKNLGARVHWANALVVLEEFENAMSVLKVADLPPESEAILNQTMSIICASWCDSLTAKKAPTADRLSVLVRGLALDATSTPLHTRVADLLQSEGEDYKKVLALMMKMLEEGHSPALIHFALGNDHWSRGRIAEARAEWEKAVTEKVPMPLAANNLAWSLAYLEPVDTKKALEIIEKAASQLPGNPQIRGTHGQVLTKLERWEEAVPKLEEVIRAGLGSPNLHRALADAYDHLNKPVLATEHRRTADELAASAPPAAPPSSPPPSSPPPGSPPTQESKSGDR